MKFLSAIMLDPEGSIPLAMGCFDLGFSLVKFLQYIGHSRSICPIDEVNLSPFPLLLIVISVTYSFMRLHPRRPELVFR